MNLTFLQHSIRNQFTSARWNCAALITGLLLAEIVANAQEPRRDETRVGEILPDAALAEQVVTKLSLDPMLSTADLDVDSMYGLVTLTGTVDTLVARHRAERLAGTIRGVKMVSNRLMVSPEDPATGDELEKLIRLELQTDSATDELDVMVRAEDGTTTLTGTANSWQQKQLAEKVAGAVKGVREIENEIIVDYEDERTDAEIREDVQAALRWDALVDSGLITVVVNDGVVSLGGVAGSAAERERALDAAYVYGVKKVTAEEMEVQSRTRDELQGRNWAGAENSEIADAIVDALLINPRTDAFDIGVSMGDEGTATLRGVVDTQAAKASAERTAAQINGVVEVVNLLQVTAEEGFDPEMLQQRIEAALERSAMISAGAINVSVNNENNATLSGFVETQLQKQRAGQIAGRIAGVSLVLNSLEVEDGLARVPPDPDVDDWPLEEEGALAED